MFSKLTNITSLQNVAVQMLRANQHIKNGSKWISISSGNNRSDVLTQQPNNNTEKLKLEQERYRMKRTER